MTIAGNPHSGHGSGIGTPRDDISLLDSSLELVTVYASRSNSRLSASTLPARKSSMRTSSQAGITKSLPSATSLNPVGSATGSMTAGSSQRERAGASGRLSTTTVL